MKSIQLSKGLVAIVDDEDYGRLSSHKWHASGHKDRTYAQRTVRISGRPKVEKMHRVIMGAPAGQLVDHRNGDGLDNRRANLRMATCRENSRNRRKRAVTSSRFVGVSWHAGRLAWRAQIRTGSTGNGHLHLGFFESEVEAALAYDRAARENFGEFVVTNFPDGDRCAAPLRKRSRLAPKLSPDDVIDIRTCHAFGAATRDLADAYGVSFQNMWMVVTFRSYRGVAAGVGVTPSSSRRSA